MKKVLFFAAALTAALFAAPAYSDDSDDATRALKEGNFEVAMVGLKPLALKGDAKAQYELAHLYIDGKGVDINLEEAGKWFQMAALKQYSPAYYYHGLFLLKGLSGKQDPTAAVPWLKKAVEISPNNDAPYLLGRMYKRGSGVEKNLANAYQWFAIGAHQGMRQAEINKKIVVGHMTPGAVIQAENQVRDWLKKNR